MSDYEIIISNTESEIVSHDPDLLTAAGQVANQHASQVVFIDYLERKSENTLRRHRADLTSFADFLFGANIKIAPDSLQTTPEAWQGMTWGIVAGFKRWLLSEGYALNSINAKLSTIRIYAGLAHQANTLTTEEFTRIQSVNGYAPKELDRVNQKREKTRIGSKKAKSTRISANKAAALKQQPPTPQGRRDAVMMCLLLDHGLRVGELETLTLDDVDLESGELHITRHKVGKTQVHALTPDTEEALYAFLYYDRYESELGTGAPLLLSSVKGGKLKYKGMTVRGIRKRVQLLGEKSGVFQLSPHDCRHYWATDAARSGTDPFALKQAGGWTSMSTVARYIDEATIANEGVRLSSQRHKSPK